MKRFAAFRFSSFLIFLILPIVSLAQNTSSDARLIGTITDSSGAGVGGVRVSATDEANAQANVWKATSTTDGEFTLVVPPGRYHIILAKESFTTREFYFEFAGGEQKKLAARMVLEPLSASVVVTAEAEPMQIQQTTRFRIFFIQQDTKHLLTHSQRLRGCSTPGCR